MLLSYLRGGLKIDLSEFSRLTGWWRFFSVIRLSNTGQRQND
jgi:hypothetical protein